MGVTWNPTYFPSGPEPSRVVFEAVLDHSEWPSGHAPVSTPLVNLRGYSNISAFYINKLGSGSASIIATPYVYVEATGEWNPLPAIAAQIVSADSSLDRMLKPIGQDGVNDLIRSPQGVLFSVEPSQDQSSGQVIIQVEAVQ